MKWKHPKSNSKNQWWNEITWRNSDKTTEAGENNQMQSTMKAPENNRKNQWWNENTWRKSDETPEGVLLKNRKF